MNITLVLPPAEKILEKKDSPRYQHIGLGYIAAFLESNGLSVNVIDAKLERLSLAKTLGMIKDSNTDILGITAMTHEINAAAHLAKEAKKMLPGVFIVIGGVHVTALPVETLKQYRCFDAGVVGEGEYTFLDIIKLLDKGDLDFSPLKGVVYRRDAEVLLSRPSEWIEDLDKLPPPAWNKFPDAREYIIITSRGCPFSCIFCMQASGRKVRKRSTTKVAEEIEKVLSERPPEKFLFYDETFTLDKERVDKMCSLIIEKGINKRIRWSVTTRVDSVDRELLLRMKEAGCDHIEFGVESGDQSVLDKIKKGITIEQAEYAVALAKEMGFHTEGAFILGHPNETLATAYKTIELASRLNPDIVQMGIMVPYPGTEVARLAKNGEGGYRIISDNWSDYNKQLGDALELDELDRSDLERLQLAGYLKLFFRNSRYKDFFKFLWNYKREALSFIRNHFRKKRKPSRSKIGLPLMLKMIFSSSPEL